MVGISDKISSKKLFCQTSMQAIWPKGQPELGVEKK